jgi:hypothetical protein
MNPECGQEADNEIDNPLPAGSDPAGDSTDKSGHGSVVSFFHRA